jgi:hypothetical protein
MLELGECSKQIEDQAALGRCGIDALRKTLQSDPAGFEFPNGLDQVRQRSTEPVEPPNDHNVALLGDIQQLGQNGSIGRYAAGPF